MSLQAELLSDGKPRKAADIYDLAKEQNFSFRTIKRVKNDIGVKSFLAYEDSGNSSWYWRLPKQDDECKSLFDRIPNFPKLPELSKHAF